MTTDHEPGEGPVVAVQEEHGERGQLTGAVPAITTVNNHTGAVNAHLETNDVMSVRMYI